MQKRLGILIIILVFLIFGGSCFAQSQFSASLTRMEKSLFGVDYSAQTDDARIKRIEEVVYGKASNSPTQARMNKLSKDLAADLMGQEIKPKRDTFEEEQDSVKEPVLKADSSVNYPMVDKLEDKVFHKSFKNVEINQRLASLEQKIFNKTYNDDLSTRVDRLKSSVMPDYMASSDNSSDINEDSSNSYNPEDIIKPSKDDFTSENYDYDDPDMSSNNADNNLKIPSFNNHNSVLDSYQSNADISVPLSALERTVLKKSFPDDTISNRLSRLELRIFNSTFIDDDPETRVDRIASAYQAKKTSKKYESNRTTQHISTAVQIGAVLLMILAAIL